MSALGQPLRAEVEITATPEELDGMVARLASADAFRRANIEYLGAFSEVRLAIEKRGTQSVVRISTDRPFNEPYVDLLVDLNWAGGRLLREFTFLLDPVEHSTQAAPAPTPAARVQSTPVAPLPRAAAPAPAAPAQVAPAAATAAAAPARQTSDQYTVARGDTLNRIAGELRTAEVSQEQMLAALYRSNAEAFIGGNINRLRAGRILKVPASGEAAAISRSEARQIVLKASSFDTYRQTMAATAAAGPARESGSGQSAGGKIAPRVEEKAAAEKTAQDKVRVTAADTAPGKAEGDAAARNRVQALQDELASRDRALKEANSRVSDLEKNVSELEKLLALKNQGLAEAQQRAAAAQSSASSIAAAPVAAASPAPAEASAVSEASAVVEAPVEASVPVLTASAPAAAQSAPQPPVIVETVAEEEDFLGRHQWAIIGGLGILAAIGYVISRQRRKRAAMNLGVTQMTEASTTSPNSVFGSAGGQTVDTGGTSLLHTDFSQSGMSAIDADEGVDPVAEADVYMAYGRDAQAEEILLDAIKNDPSRTAVYVKLLEIYAQREDQKSFENVATDLYARTQGAGDDWAKAAELGARLDPANPLYRQAPAAVPAAAAAAVSVAAVAPAALDLSFDEDNGPQTVPGDEDIPAGVVSFGGASSPERATWTVPGDISTQLAEPRDEPVTPPAAPAPAPAASPAPAADVAEPLNLDFNLDLDSVPEETQTRTRLEVREPEAEVDDFEADAVRTQPSFAATSAPLEFDLDFAAESAAPAPAPAPAELASAPAPRPAPAPVDDLDLGIESSDKMGSLSEVDLEKTNFESSLLDFDFELGEDAADKPALDLSGVNLDAAAEPSPAASVTHAPIEDSIDVDEEVSTKLELARAYEEMGDVEGARELLEEVLADGAEGQKQQARSMLDRLV
ncbi:MAG: FimV/HubP family polar landmark protein [Candidatus Dactylopiibacterium sp.]|nr:FimV/HubP family polar landmark protein [Candidatus Dactylopiibacterium sp.]